MEPHSCGVPASRGGLRLGQWPWGPMGTTLLPLTAGTETWGGSKAGCDVEVSWGPSRAVSMREQYLYRSCVYMDRRPCGRGVYTGAMSIWIGVHAGAVSVWEPCPYGSVSIRELCPCRSGVYIGAVSIRIDARIASVSKRSPVPVFPPRVALPAAPPPCLPAAVHVGSCSSPWGTAGQQQPCADYTSHQAARAAGSQRAGRLGGGRAI